MGLQLLHGLDNLHAVGYCHWDLKLDNVCYLGGNYFLIDFAYARRINDKS
jgi:tRNA A-37 threonylcarbamoyl transferase component Bud32